MAKQKKTEYEEAERTVKKIQCDDCDETWDERGDDGHNLVVLDPVMERRWSSGVWRQKPFESSSIRSDNNRMNASAFVDLCDSCLGEYFPDSAMVEVEEPEYYVDEKEVVHYSCDFCDEEMGEEPTHEVMINPRVMRTDRVRAGVNAGRTETFVETTELKHMFSSRRGSSYDTDCDGRFDCCAEDAFEIFGYDTPSWEKAEGEKDTSKGFFRRLLGM